MNVTIRCKVELSTPKYTIVRQGPELTRLLNHQIKSNRLLSDGTHAIVVPEEVASEYQLKP